MNKGINNEGEGWCRQLKKSKERKSVESRTEKIKHDCVRHAEVKDNWTKREFAPSAVPAQTSVP